MIKLSYFPGCSLAATAHESNIPLDHTFRHLGFDLVELEDWSCCGSSSAHSINMELAHDLACRNLSLAAEGRPLLVACPSCLLRLRGAQKRLETDKTARLNYEKRWQRSFDPELKILHFFEILDEEASHGLSKKDPKRLAGLKFVPYYGCMLAHPPNIRQNDNYYGVMEEILSSYGAIPLGWSHSYRCCGTYLSVARPDIVTPMVDEIIGSAINAEAECLVTACAMCQMNLEVRCTSKKRIPIMHFSELLAMGLGLSKDEYVGWFSRHLVNPKPLFKARGLF